MRLNSNIKTHYTNFVQAYFPELAIDEWGNPIEGVGQINDAETKLIPARVKLFVTKGLIAYFDEVVVEEL